MQAFHHLSYIMGPSLFLLTVVVVASLGTSIGNTAKVQRHTMFCYLTKNRNALLEKNLFQEITLIII